jgi:hypothetical protein
MYTDYKAITLEWLRRQTMPTSVTKKLPDEPILIVTLSGYITEWVRSALVGVEMTAILDASSEPLFLILDMSAVEQCYEDIVIGATKAAHGKKPLLKHPNIREILEVTTNSLYETVAESLDNPIFGNIKIRLFQTREDALAYARQVIRSGTDSGEASVT